MCEVTEELREIYRLAGERGIWFKEFGKTPAGSYLAAAGCEKELERLEKKLGRKIDVNELTMGDCIYITYPGSGTSREAACAAALAVLEKSHKKHYAYHGIKRKRRKVKELRTFTGILDEFFETGCEGLMWVLKKDGEKGYEALEFLEAGDHLTIYNEDGSVLFEGKIVPDYEAGWQEYPLNPGQGQPCALGFWIHWTQKGWKPDDWATLFIRGDKPSLRAKLIRKMYEE